MPRFERAVLLKRFHEMAARGEPIVGGGAGTGLSAKCEEAGGVDLIVIYNSGRYRMAGRGSLAGMMPYGDANAIVLEMAGEVLPVVSRTPVLAGVNGTDPFRDMDLFLDQLKGLGFSGVQNFPYVFSEAEAAAMAIAGADIVVCHLGLTTGGSIGAQTALKLEDCPARIDTWAEAALSVNSKILVLAHGGPIATPADADFIIRNTSSCHGFYGASSMERLPVELALTDQVRKFKAIGAR
jgi:predicted TIM-barrel enzyme